MAVVDRLRAEARAVSKQFGAPLVARVAASAMQAVIIVLLARMLGPTDFGFFAVSIGIGAVLGSLLGFGSSAQALRLLATPDPQRLAATLLLLRVMTAAIIAGAIVAMGWSGPRAIILLAAVYTATEVISDLCQSLMLGMQRTGLAYVALVVRRALPLTLLLAGLLFAWSPIVTLGIGWGLSAAIALLFCRSLVARPLPAWTAIRSGLHFWSSMALLNLQNLDVVLLQAVVGPALVGQYGAASRVVNPLNLFTATILSILTPKLAAATDPADRVATFRQGRMILIAYFACLLVAAPIAYHVGPWILGDAYAAAAPLFAAFTVAAGFSALSQIHVSLLYALDRAQTVAVMRLIAIPVGLAILVASTYVAGVIGAAVGIVCMQILPMVLLERTVRRAGLNRQEMPVPA